MLADLAVSDPQAFAALVEVAQGSAAGRRQRASGLSRDETALTAPDAGAAGDQAGASLLRRRRAVRLSIRSPRVKAARQLAKRAFRERGRSFLAEGPQAVREALRACQASCTELFVTAPGRSRHRRTG